MLLSDLALGVLASILAAAVAFIVVEIISTDLLNLKIRPVRTGILSWVMFVVAIGGAWHLRVPNFPTYFFTSCLVSGSTGSIFCTWLFFPLKSNP